VHLPELNGEIELRADIVIRPGDVVVLNGVRSDTNRTTILLGSRQIRVDRGGRLDLIRLAITGSIGGSALFSEGIVATINCSLVRNMAATNFVARFAELLVPAGSAADKVRKGAFAAAFGGAVFSFGATAYFHSLGSSFENNAVIGHIASFGGAITAVGGSLTLESVSVRRNLAIGGKWSAQGGGAAMIFGPLSIVESQFVGNEARQTDGTVSSAGAIMVQSGACNMSAVRLERNVARGGTLGCSGGAFRIESRSTATFAEVLLLGNQASGGKTYSRSGALDMELGSAVALSNTRFSKNQVNSGASASGGAISCDGKLTLGPGVVFYANIVAGSGRASGGAIAVSDHGQLNAVGTQFVGQLVGPPAPSVRGSLEYPT
jgi:predicted outer membrane repeat protein